jgi:hypothetical protein
MRMYEPTRSTPFTTHYSSIQRALLDYRKPHHESTHDTQTSGSHIPGTLGLLSWFFLVHSRTRSKFLHL